MKKRTPALDGFRDRGKVPRFRDDGTASGDGLFEGWDDGRVMKETVVLDVLKDFIFDLTEDRFDHLFHFFADEVVVHRVFDGGNFESGGVD